MDKVSIAAIIVGIIVLSLIIAVIVLLYEIVITTFLKRWGVTVKGTLTERSMKDYKDDSKTKDYFFRYEYSISHIDKSKQKHFSRKHKVPANVYATFKVSDTLDVTYLPNFPGISRLNGAILVRSMLKKRFTEFLNRLYLVAFPFAVGGIIWLAMRENWIGCVLATLAFIGWTVLQVAARNWSD